MQSFYSIIHSREPEPQIGAGPTTPSAPPTASVVKQADNRQPKLLLTDSQNVGGQTYEPLWKLCRTFMMNFHIGWKSSFFKFVGIDIGAGHQASGRNV